jgi:hypothetical protein
MIMDEKNNEYYMEISKKYIHVSNYNRMVFFKK